jgi:phosphatidylinositol alpha-mannosyltransferase
MSTPGRESGASRRRSWQKKHAFRVVGREVARGPRRALDLAHPSLDEPMTLSAHTPLRICVVVPYDLSERGGVKHHAFEVAHALRARGDHVEIIGPASVDPQLEGVTTFGGIVNIRSNHSDNRMALFVSPFKLRRYFREGNFDVVHVHEPSTPSISYWAAWLASGAARVCTFHAFNETPSWGIHFGQRLCQVLVERFYDHSLTVSPAAYRHATYAWRKPLAIVPNGVSTDVFVPRAGARGQSDTLKLLFVGRLSDERKGLRYVVEAYQQLLARGAKVTLDLVGELAGGDAPPALPGLTYHGAVSRTDLIRRFQECDVYVAPSTGHESFGIVLLEAMATGAPIVCSDIEGYRAVAHPDGAVLVPPRDSAALAAAITELAGDPERRSRMGAVNLEHVRAFDWKHVAASVRDEYLVAIERRAEREGVRRPLPALEPLPRLDYSPARPPLQLPAPLPGLVSAFGQRALPRVSARALEEA